MNVRATLVSVACLGFAGLIACGSDGSQFPEGSSSSGASGNGGPTIGASGGNGDSDAGLSEDGQFAKCAEARDAAERLPLHLVLLLDRSSSMCRYDDDDSHRDCTNPQSRWVVTTSALATFFANPETAGITLSLIPFPKPPTAAGDLQTQCLADYSGESILQEQPLPTSTLAGVLDAAKPANAGYVTPTTPALQGALEFASGLQAAVPAEDGVAVLFATDGQPRDCGPNRDPSFPYADADIGPAKQLASDAAAQGVPTYVIGLDDPNENLAGNLQALATAAGTSPAALISLTDPTQAANQLKDALNAVRGKALGCDLIVPAPPAGKTLDPAKINVVYFPSGNADDGRILPYSKDCSDPNGWTYDDPATPTRITLCQSSCTLAQDDPTGRLEVVLGCETQGGVVN